MIEDIVPPVVSAADLRGEVTNASLSSLFPEEAAYVARSVDRRKREFADVRRCAGQALERLGYSRVPILPDAWGAPRWPSGITGSMTHCAGYRAAALARRSDVSAVGIDAEPDGPLGEGTLRVIALPAEAGSVARLGAARPELHWDRLLFSAKEAVFKVWYPWTGQRLTFRDAEIVFDPCTERFALDPCTEGFTFDACTGGFTAYLREPAAARRFPSGLPGRWLARHGLLVTAITVPYGA
ncbi:4'-phosphopantetheinyl transferase superfamily protein [Streptomyces sp. NPDC047108]|uniref:4'-phosphopantetheinyl transferase family protein n=1 Tax=Streptomyces sp. NPDC047108 TaxID=3155025 RepID=UPI0033C5ACD7